MTNNSVDTFTELYQALQRAPDDSIRLSEDAFQTICMLIERYRTKSIMPTLLNSLKQSGMRGNLRQVIYTDNGVCRQFERVWPYKKGDQPLTFREMREKVDQIRQMLADWDASKDVAQMYASCAVRSTSLPNDPLILAIGKDVNAHRRQIAEPTQLAS